MMAPFYASERAELYRGDALAVLPKLPDGVADAVVADPPYCSGGATSAERTTRSTRDKYISGDAKHDLPDFVGDQRDQRSYTYWCTLWLADCLRLTAPGGVCLVFADWRQLPCMTDAIQAAGWTWRGVVVWHKPVARPQRGRFTNAAEYVVWGSHGALPRPQNGLCLPGMYSVNSPRGPERVHITQKPLLLLRELVQIVQPGRLVLDPFMGSGTAGVAALLELRRFIGVEASALTAEQARVRIMAAESASGGPGGTS